MNSNASQLSVRNKTENGNDVDKRQCVGKNSE